MSPLQTHAKVSQFLTFSTPIAAGIVWTVKKDITRYYSLLMTNQTVAVYMDNVVDSTFTGVYHVNVTLHFYPAKEKYGKSEVDYGELDYAFCSGPDLILPIPRNLTLNMGLWFEIENSTDVDSTEFKITPNVYRAVLEIYVLFHVNDEFWYGNYPNEYIEVNNYTVVLEDGPFREVVVSLDDKVVGGVWLLNYSIVPLTASFTSSVIGVDGSFTTNVSRSIIYSGWVSSSYGKVETKSFQGFSYRNVMVLGNDGNLQVVNQKINFDKSVDTKKPSASVHSQIIQNFRHLHLF